MATTRSKSVSVSVVEDHGGVDIVTPRSKANLELVDLLPSDEEFHDDEFQDSFAEFPSSGAIPKCTRTTPPIVVATGDDSLAGSSACVDGA